MIVGTKEWQVWVDGLEKMSDEGVLSVLIHSARMMGSAEALAKWDLLEDLKQRVNYIRHELSNRVKIKIRPRRNIIYGAN